MSEIRIPLATPILLKDVPALEASPMWADVYGRYGTETGIWSDFYSGPELPEHLKGKATHVWFYWER